MKIRRSARTIIATLLLLSVFTLFTVWHNKAPGKLSGPEQIVLIKKLNMSNPELMSFVEKVNMAPKKAPGFYLIGPSGQPAWPTATSRASYVDPMAGLGRTPPGYVLIRYRSIEDFLHILDEQETLVPGALSGLTFSECRTIPEPPLAISFRLIVSLLIGGAGLMGVKFFQRKKFKTR
jgi:hypothetical protein